MKVILLQDLKNSGQRGDIKNVADGYARNFLLPKKLAQLATENAIKDVQLKKEREAVIRKTLNEGLEKLAEKLKNRKIIIKSREEDGKLFGSVTAKNISDGLKKENFEIEPNSIIIREAIKKIGNYRIRINLAGDITTEIDLEVSGE